MAAVAQSRIQDDVHPLLRHPRPIKRDSAKAQRMLGLIADSEEKLKELQREKSVTTRWLERPMYQHLEVSDVESEKEEVAQDQLEEKTYEAELAKIVSDSKIFIQEPPEEPNTENDDDLLDKWTNPERSTSINPEVKQVLTKSNITLGPAFIKRRPDPLRLPRPVSYNAQHLLSPEWTTSPATLSPGASGQRPASSHLTSPSMTRSSVSSLESLCQCNPQPSQTQTWPAPKVQHRDNVKPQRPTSYHTESSISLESPPQQRPRPTSFATYHQRNRSGGKIASSRGLRNNSYPNYSRPMSASALKAIPGENMENDTIYDRFADDEFGPPTPASPIVEASPVRETFPIRDALAAFEIRDGRDKIEKKPKNRWSTIPHLVKKVAARRKSSAGFNIPSLEVQEVQQDYLRTAGLTEENIRRYEKEDLHTPSTLRSRLSAVNLIPTPTYSPFDVSHQQFEHNSPHASKTDMAPLPMPFAPWADAPPSPATSTDHRRRSSGASLSPTRPAHTSRLSAEVVPQARPSSIYSQRSSIVLNPMHNQSEILGSPRTASRRGTPVPDPTCIMCNASKPRFEFVEKRITENCWHDPAVCVQCLQAWLHRCVSTKGWDSCTCPECGERMARGDVTEYMGVAVRVA